MSQIFLFTGDNDFALRLRLRQWLREFEKKHGPENLSRIEASGVRFRDVLDEVAAAPFIAEKRLVVLDGVPRWSKEEFEQLVKSIHPASIILFVDPAPDRRLAGTKALLKLATVEEFTPLPPAQLQRWFDAYALEQTATFEPTAKAALLQRVGTDQQRLAAEIGKLALFASGRSVTADDVDRLVLPTAEQQVWGLMDLLGRGDAKAALAYADRQQQSESVQGLWNILLWMMSCVTPLLAATESVSASNMGAIAKQAGVNPSATRSLLPLVRRLGTEGLGQLIDRVVSYDIGVKTGSYRATTGQQQELACLFDRVLLACCDA